MPTLSFSQIIEVQSQVAQNTEALKCAQTEVNDLHRQIQTLEIDLESQKSLVSHHTLHFLNTRLSQHALISTSCGTFQVSRIYDDDAQFYTPVATFWGTVIAQHAVKY